jgi:signal transduction histidine kinase
MEDALPLASPAAWSPTATPQPQPGRDAAPEPLGAVDRMTALRDIARKLRAGPDSDETLQHVIDATRECTGSDAGMLTLRAPLSRQYVSGTALGAGPYISLPLRAGGPSFGELVLTRMSGGEEYAAADEMFAELVGEYVAKAVAAIRAGTVLPHEVQHFIDRVTEELRSPLAGAVNTIGAVLGGDAGAVSDDARRYLATADADVTRLLGTVDDLLALARLRPPDLRDMEAIPVTPWLERNVERMRPAAERRGVALTHRPGAEAYVVQGLAGQLDIVIRQLLANAIKFTEPGGRVDVTAGVTDGLVHVTVTDTGIGFDGADAPRLTERFVRAETAEAARIPGLGIGLYLAKEIVGFHNGRLWLESRRDGGTQAHLALELRRADA